MNPRELFNVWYDEARQFCQDNCQWAPVCVYLDKNGDFFVDYNHKDNRRTKTWYVRKVLVIPTDQLKMGVTSRFINKATRKLMYAGIEDSGRDNKVLKQRTGSMVDENHSSKQTGDPGHTDMLSG